MLNETGEKNTTISISKDRIFIVIIYLFIYLFFVSFASTEFKLLDTFGTHLFVKPINTTIIIIELI